MRFSTCRPGKNTENSKTIFGKGDNVIEIYEHATNTLKLVEIGSQGAPSHSGEISRFCDFSSPFFILFRFLISPTGHDSGPIRTFNSSNNVFCFVHVPYRGLEPSNSLLRGLRPKTAPKFRPLSDCRFAAENASPLEPSRVKYPYTSLSSHKSWIFDEE